MTSLGRSVDVGCALHRAGLRGGSKGVKKYSAKGRGTVVREREYVNILLCMYKSVVVEVHLGICWLLDVCRIGNA